MHHPVKRRVLKTRRNENSPDLHGKAGIHGNSDVLEGIVRAFCRCGRIVRFFGIGVLSTLADLGFLYLLTSYAGVWYMESATISYCCGILISYGMNKCLTFHDQNRHYFTQFSIFTAVSLSGLCLNLSILWMLVEVFSMHYMAAKILAIFCGFFWNYYGQSRITFRKSELLNKPG